MSSSASSRHITLHDDPGNVRHSATIQAQISLFPGPPNPKVPLASLWPKSGCLRTPLTRAVPDPGSRKPPGRHCGRNSTIRHAPSQPVQASQRKISAQAGANKGGTEIPSDKAKGKEKEKTKEKQMPKGPISNPEVIPTWAIPASSTYEGLFQAPSPYLRGWPLIKDLHPKPLCKKVPGAWKMPSQLLPRAHQEKPNDS
jgi:hypothetical protein